MPSRYRDAEPAASAPLDAVSGTMFTAFFGGVTPHAWPRLDPDGTRSDQDHYSMFVKRATAMAWLDEDESPALWGMNDAGGPWEPSAIAMGDPFAWFQVGTNPIAREHALPVQAFLRCAVDACEQFQRVDLDKVLLLLPAHQLRPRVSGSASMGTAGWFDNLDPAGRTKAEIRLAVGQSASDQVLDATITAFRRLDQRVLTSPSHAVPAGSFGTMITFHDTFWDGPIAETAVLHGDLAGWGPEAIGWVAEAVTECAAACGLASPMLMTVARAEATTLPGEDPAH
ncbi:MAG: hypothetical protein ACRCYQ_03095 [Nocardioides sp.]